MNSVQLNNTTFLLRLTQIRRGEDAVWHYVLIPAGSQEEYSFRSLADLITFLQKQMESLN